MNPFYKFTTKGVVINSVEYSVLVGERTEKRLPYEAYTEGIESVLREKEKQLPFEEKVVETIYTDCGKDKDVKESEYEGKTIREVIKELKLGSAAMLFE